MEETVDQIADRLYALPPQRFVAERAAAVAATRDSGDAATAAALRKLRRPTVAAWLVNLLALRRPELLADLADLASALHAAQQELDGEQLRVLTTRRRAAVSGLVAAARSLAHEVEPSLPGGKLPLAEVETTLTAALTDPQAAAQMRSGRLVRAVTATGFGELPKARLRLVTGDRAAATTHPGVTHPGVTHPGATHSGPDQPVESGPAREQVAAELAEARDAAAAANAALGQATTAEQEAKDAVAQLDAEIAELTARRAAATRRVVDAEAAGLEARRAAVAARRRAGEAEAMLSELDSE